MTPLLRQIVAIGVAQLIAWASTTYLIAIVARPQAESLGLSPASIYGAFSAALLLMGGVGPLLGRHIDRVGGRGVLCASSLIIAAALCVLGSAPGPATLFAGWLLLGLGMGCGLYDAAFAALVRLHGTAARGPITGITLLGGFASTLGWPLTGWLVAAWGWREACFVWAAINLCLALPLYWRFVPVAASTAAAAAAPAAASPTHRGRTFWLLVAFSAMTAFVTSALASHLPGVLLALGLPLAAVLAAAAVVGPAQVAGRLAEFAVARSGHLPPLRSGRLASALHPLGAAVLALGGVGLPAAVVFAALHGIGNGMLTIAKGVIPLHLFGAQGYGALQGRLALAQRLAQAAAPLLFALLLDAGGPLSALLVSSLLSVLALAALLAIRERHD